MRNIINRGIWYFKNRNNKGGGFEKTIENKGKGLSGAAARTGKLRKIKIKEAGVRRIRGFYENIKTSSWSRESTNNGE